MKRLHVVGFMTLGLCLCLTQAALRGDDQNKGRDKKSITNERFVQLASAAGLAEVNLGRLAGDKAVSPEVKKFGQRMVEDHAKANEELLGIANKKGLTADRQMDRKHQDLWNRLSQLTGAEFDRTYITEQVKDHEEAVELFENFSKNGQDADLKAFASKTLPTIKEHLRMARDLADKVKAGKD